jgi:hypothetical protein
MCKKIVSTEGTKKGAVLPKVYSAVHGTTKRFNSSRLPTILPDTGCQFAHVARQKSEFSLDDEIDALGKSMQ